MYILITEPNHVHYDEYGWVTMSEYGILTVTLLPFVDPEKTKYFCLHTSNVICVGRKFFGQIEDGDDSSEDEEENLRTN